MQVQQIINCAICMMDVQDPVSISCGHTMCKTCLQQLIQKQQFPTCPLCRKPTFAPVGGQWQTDELLQEVITFFRENGEKELLQEFPQFIICLSCGLTPINPVVLSCQHLFCQDCIESHLTNDLICPACYEWAAYVPNTVPINTLYNELLHWYISKNQTSIEEEQKLKSPEKIKELSVNGMPVFFYDQFVHFKQKLELMIVEDRYVEMLKIVANGSGQFPILTLTRTQDDLPMYGDLVEISRVQQINAKQVYVHIRGINRIVIKEIYTMGQQGQKIFFNIQLFQNLPGQLWLCNFDILEDCFKNDYDTISTHWFKIMAILKTCFEDLNPQLKEIFLPTFQQICVGIKQKMGTNDFKLIQEASLILIRMLKIRSSDYHKLYYTDSISGRLRYIWDHLQQIQYKLIQLLGTEGVKAHNLELEKPLQINIPQSIINLPNIELDDDQPDDNELNLMIFTELTEQQHVFMNLFKIENVIQNQE